jgi:sensor histidine kinase YesM
MANLIENAFVFNPKFRILRHSIFWILYLLYSVIIAEFGYGFNGIYNYAFVVIIDILSVYYLLNVVIPAYIIKKQNPKMFFISLLGIVAVNFTLNFINLNYIFKVPADNISDLVQHQFYNLQLSIVFIIAGAGIKLFKYAYESVSKINELEKDKISTELDFLKTQVNPHFLFNILNTLYIQTRLDPKNSAEMILKLSDLLRYQLYECSDDKVLLKSEIEYLQNYVDLQKMRITNVDIKFEQNGNFSGLMIHPFIFIPLIENAFKHGIKNKGDKNFIHIFVNIVEKYVIFAVKNSKYETIVKQSEMKNSGLGLINLKRRLDLLYKNKYELNIDNGDNYFNVELKINLE